MTSTRSKTVGNGFLDRLKEIWGKRDCNDVQPSPLTKSAQLSLRGLDGDHPPLGTASSYLAAAGGLLITTSTRRFCCRPEAESLAATGSLSPLPDAESRVEPIPCAVR